MKEHLALLIEDDSNWVNYFKETVEKDSRNCFEFHYAETLKDGLELCEKNIYSLVLLDLMLPDSQSNNSITEITKQLQYVPVVVLTVLADKKMQNFAYSHGIEDYLLKDEYDGKLFFHVAYSALNRCISRIKKEFYEDLTEVLNKLKNTAESLDKALTP